MTEKYRGTFLAALLFFCAFGIVFARSFHISIFTLTAIFAVFFIAVIILFYKNSSKIYPLFLILFFLIGAIRFTDMATLPQNDISRFSGEEVRIIGTIIEEPRITEKNETLRARYTLEIKETEIFNERKKAVGKIYFYAPYKGENAKIGDTVDAFANIKKIRPAGNPGMYDRFTHLLSEGITAEAFGGKSGVKIIEGNEYPVSRKIAEIRKHYKDAMEKVMPKEDAAAIFAMLFGGYNGLDENLTEAFTITGIIHILSVSGSHISMLAAVVAWISKIFRLNKIFFTVLIIIIIGFYTALAGFVPPALRAAVMGSIAFFGAATERDTDSKRALTLLALAFLLYNPLLLFHISFELSFLATAGLICITPKLTKIFTQYRIPYAVSASFALTIGAQLLTLPIIDYYFHRLSLSSLFANLFIVPIVEFIIVIGLFAGIVAFVLPFLGSVIFLFDSLTLGFVYELTRLLAKMPYGSVYVPTMGVFLSAIYYALFIPILLAESVREKLFNVLEPYKKSFGLFYVLFAIIGLTFVFTRPKETMFAFIDVGQGDAMVVKTPNGKAIMLDTGGSRDGAFDVGARVDVPFLLYHDITTIEYIFLTHAHEDHAAGAGGVLKYVPVKAVITANEGIDAYQKSMKASQNVIEKTEFIVPDKGDVFAVDGVTIEVLYAPKTASGENEMSNLYRVSYGAASVLVTGDMVKEDEEKLAANGEDIAATILKVGHHGSKTSSSVEFLKKVNPKFAVISVGADNTFGHPHGDTLKNLSETDTKIFRTDKDGAIFFHTDGKRIRWEKYFNSF